MAAPFWLLLENSSGAAKDRSQEMGAWLLVAVVRTIGYGGFVYGGGEKKKSDTNVFCRAGGF